MIGKKITREKEEELLYKMSLPLDLKIKLSRDRIENFYRHVNGHCTVSYSGGLDSTALGYFIRKIYPDIPFVFANTGLEFPENRRFVMSQKNLIVVKPRKHFTRILNEYGYPVISKKQAQYISEVRTAKGYTNTAKLRLTGIKSNGKSFPMGKISDKWQYLCWAPFKISHKCCEHLKHGPLNEASKKYGYCYRGVRVGEGKQRREQYLKLGCNAYDLRMPRSDPFSFWTHQDILDYISANNIPYSPLYDMGYVRSGCMFCLFGIHLDPTAACTVCRSELPPKTGLKALDKQKCPKCGVKGGIQPIKNRMQLMKETHPKQWNYCINNLGAGRIMDCIGVKYE